MKEIAFILFALSYLLSCSQKSKPPRDFSKLPPYSEFITQTKAKNGSLVEDQNRFFTFMNEEMPHFWKGTAWDYNGVTRVPKTGAIACGYFVTTLLEDFGVKLERVFLAQQASSVMINQLCEKSSVKHYNSVEDLKKYTLSRSEQEIYIVGLDFHTGFIIRDGDEVYFFHSSMVNGDGVVKEKVDESIALNGSNTFMIGSLTANSKLFE